MEMWFYFERFINFQVTLGLRETKKLKKIVRLWQFF